MPRITGAALARQSARLGHSCVILASRIWREIGQLDVREHLGDAEEAHHHRHEADAVVELDALEGQARLGGD